MSARFLAACLTAAALVAGSANTFAFAPKEKPDKTEKGKAGHAKKQKNMNGKNLVGDKIKKNGKQKFHEHGKFNAEADVQGGKIAGVSVKHLERGNVAVTKYKTKKNMGAARATSGVYFASLAPAQYDEYLGTMWIGYAYIDDYGEEIIYWFPYDMILDGETGAIEYYPVEEY